MNQVKRGIVRSCIVKFGFVLVLLLAMAETPQAQMYNESAAFYNANSRWVFPRSAGFNFNFNTPFSSQIRSSEGSAAVSDPTTGRLLFYTDGIDCYNANHQSMPNGRALHGNGNGGYPGSTAQGACIVPVIGSPNKYYLFSLLGLTNHPIASDYRRGSLFYSVVDMSLDNGSGDVVSGMKNIPINHDTLSEAMIAIPGNNCDIWLVVHRYRTAEFLSYRITGDGIDTVPVVSLAGWRYSGPYHYGTSQMAVSPDRSRIAITDGDQATVILAEFDPNTGEVFNEVPIRMPAFTYGVAFSPDNSKLYVNGFLHSTPNYTGLCQMDISVYDSASIHASKRFIPGSHAEFVSLKLYNGHLYYPQKGNNTYLYRILNPNDSGPLIFDSLHLGGSARFRMTLPTEVVMPLVYADTVVSDTSVVICGAGDSVVIQPQMEGVNGYVWDDGSTYRYRKLHTPGSYHVTYVNANCEVRKDWFRVTLSNAGDIMISVDKNELFTVQEYETYQWFFNGNLIPGAESRRHVVLENGDYQVGVTDKNGCYYLSKIYLVNNVGVPTDMQRDAVRIFPNPSTDVIYIEGPSELHAVLLDMYGAVRVVSNIPNGISLGDLPVGFYFLKVYNSAGDVVHTEKILRQ